MLGLSVLATGLMPISARGQGHHQSGVIGQVFLYACPVVTQGVTCDFPYQTTITIATIKGRFVTRLLTAADGRFTVLLKPDVYVFIPKGAGRSGLPHADPLVMPVIKK